MSDTQLSLFRPAFRPSAGGDDDPGDGGSERLDRARAAAADNREILARIDRLVGDFRLRDLQNSGGE